MLKIRDIDTTVLMKRAKEVLDKKWLGEYTSPSTKLYPHQWSWDSGFISIGYSFFNGERARKEMISLLEGQWSNGMIPHIRYNPLFENYFPDASFWNISRSKYAPSNIITSGIIQPPVITIAAYYYYRNARNKDEAKEFLKQLYPGLLGFHRFLYEERCPRNDGLVAIVHPWESGVDNSPSWESPLSRIDVSRSELILYERKDTDAVSIEERPDNKDYDRYIYLIEIFKKVDYEQHAVLEESPFLVYDILFNTILCRANECLIELGKLLNKDTGDLVERLESTRKSIQECLWDKESGLYLSYDLRANSIIKNYTASSFCPLFAGIPDHEQVQRIYNYVDAVCQCHLEVANRAIPSYSRCKDDFTSDNYWKGPVWTNMNWIIYEGLKRYMYLDKAEEVRESMLRLIDRYGFYEYFDPIKKEGCGIDDFSWTAALTIAMCLD